MAGKYWTVSLNPLKVTGGGYHCTKCSPGCDHCWAERHNLRKLRSTKGKIITNGIPYDNRPVEFVLDQKVLKQPLHWRKPQVVFVCDLCDLFHEQVPFEFINKIYKIILHADRHQYLILTKRAKGMLDYYTQAKADPMWEDRILPGLTICNQSELDEKAVGFLQIPGHKWLSIEPMLGPILIPPDLLRQFAGVIVGGESGPGARLMHPDWVRSIRDQCAAAGVKFHLKQWGGKRKDRLLDGREHNDLAWNLPGKENYLADFPVTIPHIWR